MWGTIQLMIIGFVIELGLYRIISGIFTKYAEKLFKEPNGLINLDRMHRWTMFIVLWLNIALIVAGGVYVLLKREDTPLIPRIPFISDMKEESEWNESYRSSINERVELVGQRMRNPEYFDENDQLKLQNIEKEIERMDSTRPDFPTTKNNWTRGIILMALGTWIFYYLTR